MNHDVLVSVIIPMYNANKYIEETINSALGQTHSNLEIIVVDDQSTDNSYEIVADLAEKNEKIRVFRQGENCGGPAWGRNYGLKKARGEYVAFLDADDFWAVQKIEFQLRLALESSVTFISSLKEEFVGSVNIESFEKKYVFENLKLKKIVHNRLLQQNIIPNSSVFAHKSLFDSISFREDPNYIAVEDFNCWLNIHQTIDYSLQIQSPFLFYRILEDSISRSKLGMFKKVWNLLDNYEISGRKLRLMKYFYLLTYVIKSILQRIT